MVCLRRGFQYLLAIQDNQGVMRLVGRLALDAARADRYNPPTKPPESLAETTDGEVGHER